MVSYNGSHGTTVKRADQITSEGFRLSGGRFVRGAYFWLESHFYYDLAVGWYKYCIQDKRYDDEVSPRCAVIFATLFCNDDEFIDLERPDFKDRLARLSEVMGTNQSVNREIFALYTYAIREIEKIGGVRFKIFLLKVPPPDEAYCPRYKKRILGYPTCVIAVSRTNIKINDKILPPKV